MIILRGQKAPIMHNRTVVSCKKCGNIVESVYMSYRNNKANIKKLNKDEYELLSTGEIKEFQHKENRAEDLGSIRVSMRKLRDYINTNVSSPRNCRWITLTYAENMSDTKRLYDDCKNFMKRFRYKYGECEYIMAVEPQGRGAWHLHVIMIFNQKAPYIPNEDLSQIWGQGFTKVTKITNVDNVGAYLTAYLCDTELQDGDSVPKGCEVKEMTIDGKKKRFVKGARLSMYPPGINLYRISRGIKKPEITLMREEDFQEVVKNCKQTYEKTVLLIFEDENIEPLKIYYRYYNLKGTNDNDAGIEKRNQAA